MKIYVALQGFFYWRIFAKHLPEKYDFDLQEGFSMKKMAQIRKLQKQIRQIFLLILVSTK